MIRSTDGTFAVHHSDGGTTKLTVRVPGELPTLNQFNGKRSSIRILVRSESSLPVLVEKEVSHYKDLMTELAVLRHVRAYHIVEMRSSLPFRILQKSNIPARVKCTFTDNFFFSSRSIS